MNFTVAAIYFRSMGSRQRLIKESRSKLRNVKVARTTSLSGWPKATGGRPLICKCPGNLLFARNDSARTRATSSPGPPKKDTAARRAAATGATPMKSTTPHDPRNDAFDDLIAAALHGDLTPDERLQFETRLSNDPAAQAAYLEAQAMHDMLEKTHRNAQPDSDFEQRMISGVRRKLRHEQHRETAWESALVLWNGAKRIFGGRSMWIYGGVCSTVMVIFLGILVYSGNQVKGVFTTISSQLAIAGSAAPQRTMGYLIENDKKLASAQDAMKDAEVGKEARQELMSINRNRVDVDGRVHQQAQQQAMSMDQAEKALADTQTRIADGSSVRPFTRNGYGNVFQGGALLSRQPKQQAMDEANAQAPAAPASTPPPAEALLKSLAQNQQAAATDDITAPVPAEGPIAAPVLEVPAGMTSVSAPSDLSAIRERTSKGLVGPPADENAKSSVGAMPSSPPSQIAEKSPAPDTRKLIRNAQLDLEIKSFQAAMDQIAALTKAAGGYIDTSNSQKGGNGKLQGTIVVKILPQNLDGFLLKLRDLGEVQNQSVSTDDVTKDYYDTQARLDNSRRMETQLQDLLKRENGKVSDLLAVERELERVRGDIEQMQGQLKLYDFQVQYATITMQLHEKDLNQAAAYLLKEQDDFSLFATDVEGTFQKARQAADDFKAQILVANLAHNSGSDVAAELTVMVTPDQIEPFLGKVRGLGRVANFTRQTQRVARDGGDSNQPADETLTEKDKVQVHLAIRSDDESRKQVALTVVAKAVDDALDQAKTVALANAGVEILSSSLNKSPQGQSTAQLSVRVPGQDYAAVIEAFKALGRTASLSIQRNDDSGPGSNGDDAPVIVSLSLTDDDTPLQQTEMSVLASDVDNEAQQIKKDAAAAGVEVKASSFERQPDGTELAQMTFRLPMGKYPAFVETVKRLGKVESLSVRRDDRPDQTLTDDNAPAEINLQLHNQRDIVTDDNGLWATLRQTFGEGAGALFGSVRVIGVLIAFITPWLFTLLLLAWVGRRIYVWRKNR